MATDVSISSNALLMLGSQPINAMDEVSDGAKLASNLYAQVRDQLLRDHTWNCAKKRVALAPDAATPEFDYSYKFALPFDWLRVIQVGQRGERTDYRIEGTFILCDDNPLYLVYVYKNTVEATWDSQLVHAMTLSMKAAMAYAVTKSTSVREDARQELKDFLKRSRSIDGQDEPSETLGDERLYNAGFNTAGY